MGKKWLFDRPWTEDFTKVRESFVADTLESTRRDFTLSSALDVGCGVGHFSKFLYEHGLRVVGVDGRDENVAEARRRHPQITFATSNAEELSSASIGPFDLTLCFGLLYHLENPFRTIRHLHALTDKLLLIEGMCVPDSKPTMSLFDESTQEDQGLNYVAFYPSEPCLIKMLYRAGFPFVYRLKQLPHHALYTRSVWRKPVRTILVASKMPVNVPSLSSVPERSFVPPDTSSVWSRAEWNPWSTGFSILAMPFHGALVSLRAFAARLVRPFRKSLGS